MDVAAQLTDLAAMHPRLLWDDIIAAGAAVLATPNADEPTLLELRVDDVPGFGSKIISFRIDVAGVSSSHVARLQRTYDSSRLVELAAIAIAGLALYHGGGHEIRDVALRGNGADYLVDESNTPLEVAGRSRKGDFAAAWQTRWDRLVERVRNGFYVCVAEFQTPAGRLAFAVE